MSYMYAYMHNLAHLIMTFFNFSMTHMYNVIVGTPKYSLNIPTCTTASLVPRPLLLLHKLREGLVCDETRLGHR